MRLKISSFLILAILMVLAGCATAVSIRLLEFGEPAMESGSIVFTGIDGNLYVAEPEQEALVALTTEAETGRLEYPAYAWSGAHVVYAAQEVTASGRGATTFYAHRPGERPEEIASLRDTAAFYLYPTPDGRRVSYLSGSPSGAFVMGSVGIDAGDIIEHGRGQPFYWAWSPDGDTAVTHTGSPNQRGGSALAFSGLTSDGAAREPERISHRPGTFRAPAFLPDGRGAAVVLSVAGRQGIYVVTDGGTPVGPIAPTRGAVSMAWSPNGRRLAYVDGAVVPPGAIAGALRIVSPGTGESRRVSDEAIAYFWSPDSTQLLFFEPFLIPQTQGVAVGLQMGVYSLLTDSVRMVTRFLPTSAWFGRILPFVDQYQRGTTIWSPDSRTVVIDAIGPEGLPVVYLVDPGSGEPPASPTTGRTARAYTVASRLPVQDTAPLSMAGPQGGLFRAIAVGTVPFFSTQ